MRCRGTRWTMRRWRVLAGLGAALVVVLAGGTAAASASTAEPPTDRLLIKFRDAAARPNDGRGRVEALALRSVTPMRYLRTIYDGAHTVHLGRFMRGAELSALVARLAGDPQVEMVAPDRIKRAQAMPNDPLAGPTAASPNGEVTQQWYLQTPSSTVVSSIDAVRAWDLSHGSATVPVAVVDTGVLFNHPDLGPVASGGKLLPGYDMVGSDASSSPPTYFVANDMNGADPDPTDPGDWINSGDLTNAGPAAVFASAAAACTVAPSSWHGTLVAGIIGAATNNGIGIAGIGWDSPVLPVRALGKCIGYDSDILDAMAWAAGLAVPYPDTTSPAPPVNPNPVRIINLSLGGTGACSTFYQSLLSQLTAPPYNVVVVAAAGNGAGTAGAGGAVSEPANCPGVIAVAALRYTGTKVGFSNFGPEVALSAPGGNCLSATVTAGPPANPCQYSIVSTSNDGTEAAGAMNYIDGNAPAVKYSGQSFIGGGAFGTSFSAPMVAGVVALMLSANSNLDPAHVRYYLQVSARPFPAAGSVPVCPSADPNTGECACPPPPSPSIPLQCGAGMLDAYRAVQTAISAPPIPTASPSPNSGGGGASSPWWILLVLAAAAVRARTARSVGSGRRYFQ
jgi:serine protease